METILVSYAIVAFGLIWRLVNRDLSFLSLTAAVGVLAGLKILSLHWIVQQHYEVLEGIVCSNWKDPLRKRHLLALTQFCR